MDKTPKGQWRKHKGKTISWNAAGAETLRTTIASVTEAGGAILFSGTRDGGALVLSIYSGNDTSKEYVTEASDIPALLAWVIETYA